MTQVANVADTNAIHLELEDGVGTTLGTVDIVVESDDARECDACRTVAPGQRRIWGSDELRVRFRLAGGGHLRDLKYVNS